MHKEISWKDPSVVFAAVASLPGAIFFDSANEKDPMSRYSFIGVDPFAIISGKDGRYFYQDEIYHHPFDLLQKILHEFVCEDKPNLPPFQGGMAGLLSYELNQTLEKLPQAVCDDLQFPDVAMGLYDLVIAFDYLQKKIWIFSTGHPEKNATQRLRRAKKRLNWLTSLFQSANETPTISTVFADSKNLQQHFTQSTYEAAIRNVKEKIFAGDIFQANISRRFSLTLPENLLPIELYWRLRQLNPAPFAAYFHCGETVIASASPERFITMREGNIETRPIKGTLPRGETPEADKRLANQLLNSAKDRAENIMIVDLMRNDLSRIAKNHTVKVSRLCQLESYPTVHHLVSVVQAKCRDSLTAIDVLRATFPGGSVTGAPKIRAMEIIAEVEPVHRGPYCGSLMYLGFNGAMDSSILIRTYAIKKNTVTFHAGGAIVADSDPAAEYDETTVKASALLRALVGER